MPETWTIKRVLDWTVGYLGRKGDERPRLSLCRMAALGRDGAVTRGAVHQL